MATEYTGNAIPAASVTDGPDEADVEILLSTQGWTQKGVTLKPGQGVIPAGCVMAQETSTKLWVIYDTNGSDGYDTARGILRQSVDTGTEEDGKRYAGNIVVQGILRNSVLSGADGSAISDLNARQDTVQDMFVF